MTNARETLANSFLTHFGNLPDNSPVTITAGELRQLIGRVERGNKTAPKSSEKAAGQTDLNRFGVNDVEEVPNPTQPPAKAARTRTAKAPRSRTASRTSKKSKAKGRRRR